MGAFVPPGWPAEVLPPEVEDWQQSAVAWLLDQAPAHWRQDPVLRAQSVLLARRVVEHLCADVAAARAAWVPLEQWVRAGLPEDAHDAVREMLARQGPTMTARLRSAELVRDALTSGRLWRLLL